MEWARHNEHTRAYSNTVALQTQELPSLVIPLWLWCTAPEPLPLPNKALLIMFVAHYAHR